MKAIPLLPLFMLLAWGALSGADSSAPQASALAVFNLTESTNRCDREASRMARNILHEYVLEPHGVKPEQLPHNCPMHPSRDMFADHEKNKGSKNTAHKQCKYCNKVFKTDQYLDRHMQRKHLDKIPEGATHCLADMCDVLHCDWFSTAAAESSRSGRRRRPPPKAANSMMRDAHCMPHEAQRTRTACQELANACFPVDTHADAATAHHHALKEPAQHPWDTLHEFWLQSFCQAATCAPGARDTLLKQVQAGRRNPSRIALIIVLVVVVAMAIGAVLMCVMADRTVPTTPARRAGTAQQARRGPPAASADPSGKLNRKPHAPPAPTQAPYVARRTPSTTTAAVAVGSGALGPRPGGTAAAQQQGVGGSLFASGQQMLEAAAGSVVSSLPWPGAQQQQGLTSAGGSGPVQGLASPGAGPGPGVPTQVVWAGGVAGGHQGSLHARAGHGQPGTSGGGAGPLPQVVGGAGTGAGLHTWGSGGGLATSTSLGHPTQGPGLQQQAGPPPPALSRYAAGSAGGGGLTGGALAGGLSSVGSGPLMGAPWGQRGPARPPDKAD